MPDLTVAVVGGSGFLGRHVVAQLEQWAAEGQVDGWGVKQVRVLDIVQQDADTGSKGVAIFEECDIRNADQLTRSLKGADAVVNCAAVSPDITQDEVRCGPDMWRANVDGVRNLVQACREAGVGVLVHTSTLAVKMGGQKLMEHTESLTPHISEDALILGDYARGRVRAEELVLEAHNGPTQAGTRLRTVVLRPPLLYGEGDRAFVPYVLRLARAGANTMPSFGNPDAFQQAAYVGNAAAAHVMALRKLLREEDAGELQHVGGLPVYVTDDTPPNSLPGLAYPFLRHLDLQPARNLSYWTVAILLLLAKAWGAVLSALGMGSPGPSALPSWTIHRLGQTIAVVSRMRAELSMGYAPPFSWPEALARSTAYYSAAFPGEKAVEVSPTGVAL